MQPENISVWIIKWFRKFAGFQCVFGLFSLYFINTPQNIVRQLWRNYTTAEEKKLIVFFPRRSTTWVCQHLDGMKLIGNLFYLSYEGKNNLIKIQFIFIVANMITNVPFFLLVFLFILQVCGKTDNCFIEQPALIQAISTTLNTQLKFHSSRGLLVFFSFVSGMQPKCDNNRKLIHS